MKHIFIIALSTLLLASCGNKEESVATLLEGNDLEKLRAKKSALDEQYNALGDELKQLEAKIKELDPLEKVPLITTFTVQDTVFNHFVELQGNVSTKKNLVLFPEYSGVLTRVHVKEGQKVGKGQLLASIDDGGLSQQLSQMQIQADLAKTTFERQERLWNQKIGSEIQYLQAKSNYEAQERAIGQMRQQIAKTSVRAPFSGTIDDVITEQGSMVMPGQTQLFRIVNLDEMYVETDVPERYISNVTKDKMVEVEFPILGKSMEAKVRQAGDFINPANRTFRVEIGIDNKDRSIKPNLTAKLKINDYTNENALLIPQSIISENAAGEQYVYVIAEKNGENAKAKRVIIETGKTQGDLIEVLSGFESGAEIIEEGARSVRDGQEVKILTY